jgi:hypothetical protein
MSLSGSQSYTFNELRERINDELLNEHMPERLYKSTDGIMRVINAIVKTNGNGWAAQVLNNKGNPLLTNEEQERFTEVFQPYLESIIDFFGGDEEIRGGAYKPDISKMSGMSKDFLKTKAAQATYSFPIPPINPLEMASVDDLYSKIYHKIGNVNSTVNEYASKYGVLKLEKEHDLEEDIRVIPPPAAMGISQGVLALSTAAGFPIPPNITLEVLSKIKVPFRTIVFTIYLILDIARIAIGIVGPASGRKIMSLLLSILELLRGDWKKALLTIIGYYGAIPLLIGELMKVFLTLFRMFSPQIQHSIIFGSLDAAKSFIVGFLLAVFQVTAPEQVRLPLIGILEKVAQHKAKMDGTLQDIGLSARPAYLSPTWQDLNNIQAVFSDEAYICSCEFRQLVDAINQATIIRIILGILRIPVNEDMIMYKCGKGPCKDFVTSVVSEAKDDTEAQKKADEPLSLNIFKSPAFSSSPSITGTVNTATAAVTDAKNAATEGIANAASSAVTGALTNALKPKEEVTEEEKKEETENPEEVKANEPKAENIKANEPKPVEETTKQENPTTGGRILHSRLKKFIA